MEHKAYLFAFTDFESELYRPLCHSLVTEEAGPLVQFIDENWRWLKDPSEGEPISKSWRTQFQSSSIDDFGDLALTKYYDPRADFGLNHTWERVDDLLGEVCDDHTAIVLGYPLIAGNVTFDPGKMGSYFRSADHAEKHLDRVRSTSGSVAISQRPMLSDLIALLQQAVVEKVGIYVTF